jgi:hypothetical protein
MVVKTAAEQRAFVVGRQAALRKTSELVDQLTAQLFAAREELAKAKTEYFAKIEATKRHFDEETDAMRREMAVTVSLMNELKLSLLDSATRRTDTLQ